MWEWTLLGWVYLLVPIAGWAALARTRVAGVAGADFYG